MTSTEPVLVVRRLRTAFETDRGPLTAVDDVGFELGAGETLGLVGESGCGKTVTAKSILRLLPEHQVRYGADSEVLFRGGDLLRSPEKRLREVRGAGIAMVFQEASAALSPVYSVGWQLDEALRLNTGLGRADRRRRVVELLEMVELPEPGTRAREYPHQLSGGMRQRVMLAVALAGEPEVLIADEPTTALDVTVQAQILSLVKELQQRLGTALLWITHDLRVVAQICDRVLVMYAGRTMESGTVKELFERPRHPYTRALLESVPRAERRARDGRLPAIEGSVPSLFELPSGCRFHERCASREDQCARVEPELVDEGAGRRLRCHFPCGEGR